jgi:enamidase
MPQLREQYVTRYTAIQRGGPNAYGRVLAKDMAWEKQFHDAGGLLVAGTDPTGYGGVVPGFSNVRQIELLEEAGLTRAQALKVACMNGAEYLGRQKDVGSIAVGKRADLILLSANPLADIRNVAKQDGVMIGGKWLPRDEIQRQLAAMVAP